MWTERALKEQSWGLLSSTASMAQAPTAQVCFQETSCWTEEKGGGDILYQGCDSQFQLCIFPMVVLAAWLAEWLAGCMWRNVLWSGAQHRETGTGGCWVITWPQGCLFKLKSCLDYCSQTLLSYCSCMRHKSRVEKKCGGRRKGDRREEVWIMSSLLPRKRHKQKVENEGGRRSSAGRSLS